MIVLVKFLLTDHYIIALVWVFFFTRPCVIVWVKVLLTGPHVKILMSFLSTGHYVIALVWVILTGPHVIVSVRVLLTGFCLIISMWVLSNDLC